MERENTKPLLDEFAPHTYEAWKEAAVQLLKGRPFEKTLFTPTYEGFSLEPIYTGETTVDFAGQADPPGMGTRVRGSRIEGYLGKGWLISQELSAPTARELNAIALKELENGQNELNIWLDLPSRRGRSPQAGDGSSGVCGLSLSTAGEMKDLLEGIHPEMISLYFQSGRSAPAVYALLLAALGEGGTDAGKLSGCLGMDPLGWLAEQGMFPGESERLYDTLADVLRYSMEKTPHWQVLDVQGHVYHNNGGSSVLEMAALLATAVTYVREMVKRGLSAGEVVSRMRLSASIGGNFFLEIGKFRALRLLWNRVMEAFDVPGEERRVHLHARTGQWNKTVFDPYVNMLRTTTEAFSAVAGGCDSLHVAPFDEILRESDAFSRRVARNTHAILAEECGMTQVIDPGGGSWSVESLTDKMAAEAWKRFQEIERLGGMTEVLKSGWFAEAVASVREERRKNIQRRKDIILGTNTYPNPGEKLPPSRKIDYTSIRKGLVEALDAGKRSRDVATLEEALAAVRNGSGTDRVEAMVAAASAGATLEELMEALDPGQSELSVEPFVLRRGAEDFEALRFAARAVAESGQRPLVHQLNIGPSRRYRNRADWTSSFFHAAGIEVLNEDDYLERADAVEAVSGSGARYAIITSDDETYAAEVVPLARALKEADKDLAVFVAGAPGENEESWRAAGVDDFVHLRVNNYLFNRGLLESMGAEIRTNA